MKQFSLFIIFWQITFFSFAQVPNLYSFFSPDHLVDDFINLSKKSKAQKLKSVTVISYKNLKQKKGKLKDKENYDSLGNIRDKITYFFVEDKGFEKINYYYDSLNRMQKIISSAFVCYEIKYLQKNEVDYILTNITFPRTQKYDTLRYTFYENGKIKTRTKNNDTTFYLYSEDWKYFYISSTKTNSSVKLVSDKNGCGGFEPVKINDNSRTIIEYDSLCNQTKVTDQTKVNGEWVTQRSYKYLYLNGELSEMYAEERINEKLQFSEHTKWEYNAKSDPSAIIEFDKKGKVTEVLTYFYEYYPMK